MPYKAPDASAHIPTQETTAVAVSTAYMEAGYQSWMPAGHHYPPNGKPCCLPLFGGEAVVEGVGYWALGEGSLIRFPV